MYRYSVPRSFRHACSVPSTSTLPLIRTLRETRPIWNPIDEPETFRAASIKLEPVDSYHQSRFGTYRGESFSIRAWLRTLILTPFLDGDLSFFALEGHGSLIAARSQNGLPDWVLYMCITCTGYSVPVYPIEAPNVVPRPCSRLSQVADCLPPFRFLSDWRSTGAPEYVVWTVNGLIGCAAVSGRVLQPAHPFGLFPLAVSRGG